MSTKARIYTRPKAKIECYTDQALSDEECSPYSPKHCERNTNFVFRNKNMPLSPSAQRARPIQQKEGEVTTYHIGKDQKNSNLETGEVVCEKCKKVPFSAEKLWGPEEDDPWDKYCLKCNSCGRCLESATMHEYNDKPYCVSCYNKRHANSGKL